MSTIKIVTPVGRLVQGSPFERKTTNMQNEPLVYKSGPNMGQPREEVFCAIAVSKTNPEWANFNQKLIEAGKTGFPHLFTNGVPSLNNFSWKYIDGDGMDSMGRPYADKEGFAGHYVFKMTTSYSVVVVDNSQPAQTITEGIKKGDYVRAIVTVSGNNNAQKPGIYSNLELIQFVRCGAEIDSGPDYTSMLNENAVGYIPQEASETPPANALPGTPAAATPVVTPDPTILMPPTQEPVVPKLIKKLLDDGHTIEKLLAQNYTMEQMKANKWLEV